jgi:putative acetyltransferase
MIRVVAESDNFKIAKMIREVFEEHNAPRIGTVYSDPTTDDLYSLFQTPRSVLWVAEIDGKPQGCCGIFPTPGLDSDCAELVKFYLSPKIRGKGVGRQLMEKCIHSAVEMGYKQLYLESMPEFGKAVRIYQKLGFTPLSGPMGHSGHSGCTIWMVKEL